jgi:predicted ATP-grasp superfamily ATP-dependent carboligase
MYTGGIENYPELVDRLAARHRLWGNLGTVLRAVRDPFQCAEAFLDAGIDSPPVKRSPDGLPCDSSWLEKPLCGSGGAGLRPWKGEADRPRGRTPLRCFQKRIAGTPCSAVFAGAGGRSVLLGVTWQLVGPSWTGAAEFGYAGSIGPVTLDPRLETQWNRIGSCIAERFSLVGLFGVDAILDGQTVWPVEVNPRYPASVEVLERAFDIQALRIHADVCCSGRLPERVPRAGTRRCGKAILYAPADVRVSPEFGKFAEERTKPWPWPDLADVPEVGTRLRRGKPVTTVFAEASAEAPVRDLLELRIDAVRRLLFGSSSRGA